MRIYLSLRILTHSFLAAFQDAFQVAKNLHYYYCTVSKPLCEQLLWRPLLMLVITKNHAFKVFFVEKQLGLFEYSLKQVMKQGEKTNTCLSTQIVQIFIRNSSQSTSSRFNNIKQRGNRKRKAKHNLAAGFIVRKPTCCFRLESFSASVTEKPVG